MLRATSVDSSPAREDELDVTLINEGIMRRNVPDVLIFLSYSIIGFKIGARLVRKFPLCVFVDSFCISALQDSSVSIFDHLSGLITDSFLCACSNFGDYPITARSPANNRVRWGGSLPCVNWKEERCQSSKEGLHH